MPDDFADYANIETFENCSFSDSFTLVDESGVPLNLTGASATAHFRKGTPDAPGPIVLNISTANGKLTIGAGGVITRTLTVADLGRATVPASDYWYELVVTLSGGQVEHPATGYCRHNPTAVGLV